MDNNFSVKDLPAHERPRERLFGLGVSALSTPELLAIILGQGIRGNSVLAHAQGLLANQSLGVLAQKSMQDLMQMKGIGLAKASQLVACFELGWRLQMEEAHTAKSRKAAKKIISANQISNLARSKIKDFNKEYCVVLSFDIRGKLIATDELSVGVLNNSLVHPRETFGLAIARHAASIVLAHNHPSGDLEPSAEDLDITTRLVTAGKIMGIEFLDHLILSKSSYLSLREQNLL
jgi:DNA repair protein RadC